MQQFRLFYKCTLIVVFVLWLPLITGCKKLLDAGSPENKVITAEVFTSDSLAQAAVIGVYTKMMEVFGLLNGYMSRYPGLSCDELYGTGTITQDQPFLTNSIPPDNIAPVWEIWNGAYSHIYRCNELVAGFTGTNSITPALRDQLLGEAYFLRALTYFYLINLYGDVPLVVTTDYTKSATAERTPVGTVYDKLTEDLKEAQSLLSNVYATTPKYPNSRVRVNKQAAMALLARIYLYRGEWTDAAAAATEVISSGLYQLETDLQQTFRYTSKEAILQFMPVLDAYNTAEGSMFVPIIPNGRPAIVFCDSVLNKMDPADARWSWVRTVTISGKKYSSPYKYKLNTGTPREEYNMVLRLAEQYLIRAESRARLNQLPEAVSDLNAIRKRAGLPDLNNITTQVQALFAVEQERRIELFAEWGHRWFDLKRWPAGHSNTPSDKKRIDEVMGAMRPDDWNTTDVFWPIPATELIHNPNLTQNPGYN